MDFGPGKLEAPPGFEPGMEVLQIQRGRESCCLVLVFGLSSSMVLPDVRAVLDYKRTTVRPPLRRPAQPAVLSIDRPPECVFPLVRHAPTLRIRIPWVGGQADGGCLDDDAWLLVVSTR
jgi:hypothetical protein